MYTNTHSILHTYTDTHMNQNKHLQFYYNLQMSCVEHQWIFSVFKPYSSLYQNIPKVSKLINNFWLINSKSFIINFTGDVT